MSRFAKIEERDDIIKDMETGALLKVDRDEAERYKAKKAMMVAARESRQQINNIEEKLKEVDSLKKDIDEIKSLLKQLVK